MIELSHISTGYGIKIILNDVSVAFEKGKLTSIIGANGCGKSTLLKTILGILPSKSGNITIDGTRLKEMSRNDIARRIAYLSQEKNTPDMTVEQLVLHGRFPHLSYPRRYTDQDRVIAVGVMEQMGIVEYAHKPLYSLSGGMKQNSYIAMALAQETDYILLDEPTTYLDIAHQLELMKILRSLADSGKGIVAVMHDLPMAFTFSDKIILINDGRIVDDERPEKIYERNIIDKVFGIALDRSKDGRSYSYKY
ncbi:MAG: ABC transporter ATP-binding protein [Eubacteriales bacterium]